MKHRRRFLTLMGAALGAATLGSRVPASTNESARNRHRSLIPEKRSTAPNYWCTWAAQNYLHAQQADELDASVLEGTNGAVLAQKALNEQVLLGHGGWSKTLHARVRDELYLLLDDGWQEGGMASFQLDSAKFPSFQGPTEERLRRLNEAVRADGWRALALWCRRPPGGADDEARVGWVKFAGIPYLKIDGGDSEGSLARARARQQATLTLEHVHGESSLSGNWREDGRFGQQSWDSLRLQILRNTDVFRIYDATAVLGVPTTLDRAAQLLSAASGRPEARALLNLEDEVYIAAVLGCTMGVMRHSYRGLRPGEDADVFLPRPRQLKQRMDEVVRAIRWQRIAAPYAAGTGAVALDSNVLTDDWTFRRGETFDVTVVGHHAKQGAPARIARSMALPEVSSDGEPPYVACARFPSGAAAIGAFERVSVARDVSHPRAAVRWLLGNSAGPFGIFGHFGTLTLVFDRSVKQRRILAQDLAGDLPIDITDQVRRTGAEIVVPGELIDRIGRSAATPGDLSLPGIVLAV